MLTLKWLEWQTLVEQLKLYDSVEERLEHVDAYLGKLQIFPNVTQPLYQLVLKSLVVIGQDSYLLKGIDGSEEDFEPFLKSLVVVEEFYQEIGGLIGYYVKVLELYLAKAEDDCAFSKPCGVDFTSLDPKHLVRVAIESLHKMGGLFPVGGAGDRLDFRDEETGASQSVAIYPFLGRSLLEGLLRDVRGLEFLGAKLMGRSHSIPLMFMTSAEKNNHEHVVNCLIDHKFFGKPQKDFLVVSQPLVPLIDEEGHFVLKEPLQLMLKPGGHGAIWKVALQHKAFQWFEKKGGSYLFLRQINNPIGGVDFGWLAFLGEGIADKKSFGFSVCQRRVKSSEGMIALIKSQGRKWIGNIEYTDFKKRGVVDEPEDLSSSYSVFPANTNILFANLQKVKEAALHNPHPGLVLNPKHEVRQGVVAGRLESTMQHMGDQFTDPIEDSHLSTYMTFNKRYKTISPIKKAYSESILETPVGALYDVLRCAFELFHEFLDFDLPLLPKESLFDGRNVPFFIGYHPALGPLYTIIAQKIQKGRIALGSELILEVAELEMKNLDLAGSMVIEAENFLGRVHLKNVTVRNRGIDETIFQDFSRGEVKRCESFHVKIQGNGEFFAEDVIVNGDFKIEVKENTCIRASMNGSQVVFTEESLRIPYWSYSFNETDDIILKKIT